MNRWIPRRLPRGMTALLLCLPLQAAQLNSPAPAFPGLSANRGKVVLINFWASWCGPCQEELPELNRLAAAYKGRKVKVLAINVDENRAAAQKLLGRLGIAAPELTILWDPKSKIVGAYKIDAMPSSF